MTKTGQIRAPAAVSKRGSRHYPYPGLSFLPSDMAFVHFEHAVKATLGREAGLKFMQETYKGPARAAMNLGYS